MRRLVLAVVSLVVLAGCKEVDPAYCASASHADNPICPDAATTGGPCKSSTDCTVTPGFPVCDTTDNNDTCVQCTTDDHALCMGLTPHCEDHACAACVDDNGCGGTGVCLPTGGCADSSNIIHAVSTSGSAAPDCGAAGNACTLTAALTVVKAGKDVIKLDDPGIYVSDTSYVVDSDPAIGLTIDARGAVLRRTTAGPILTFNSDKAATILGGTIEGATGGGGDGIQCKLNATLNVHGTTIRANEESAIDAATCTLTVTGADIRGNSTKSGSVLYPGIQISDGSITISRSSIVSNRGGGIVVNNNGKFEFVGNVFSSNGDSLGNVGGVSVNTAGSGSRLEFNTITQNKSDMALAAGVQCTLAGGFTAQNNIIWNNNSALGTNGIQVSGCLYAYSDIGPAITPTGNDGGNNLNANPSFVNNPTDLHLQLGTSARGKANPDADLTGIASKDIDGKVRTRPADLGAYVAPPQ